MKPALVAAIMLAFAVNFVPRCEAKQIPTEVTKCSNYQQPGTLAAIFALSPFTHGKSSASGNDSTQNQPPYWDKPPEWVLPLIGIITAGFICWQSWETRKAAQATQKSVAAAEHQAEIADKTLILQFRPKLVVRVRNVLELYVAELGEQAKARIEFVVANVGGSAAHIIQSELDAQAIQSSSVVRIFDSTTSIGTFSLEPGAANVHFFECSEDVSRAIQWANASHKGIAHTTKKYIYFVGVIWYADDLGIGRSMGFSRIYDQSQGTFVLSGNTDAEYND